jgi:hypothetical protein
VKEHRKNTGTGSVFISDETVDSGGLGYGDKHRENTESRITVYQ